MNEAKSAYRVVRTRNGPEAEFWTIQRTANGTVRVENFHATNRHDVPGIGKTFEDGALMIRSTHHVPYDLGREPLLEPGTFHPRIHRPCPCDVQRHQYAEAERHCLHAIHAMLRRLDAVLSFVSPDPANKDAFGPEIRLLLISACTEVEAEWKGVMEANGAAPAGNVFITKDYVRLLEPMHLADWSVEMINHPEWGPLVPFAGWNVQNPSKSLPWYHAYNGAKHDRQPGLRSSTLGHALSAVAGLVVLYAAQFGDARMWERDFEITFSTSLRISRRPDWPLEEVYYGFSTVPSKYTAVPFF